MNGLLLHLDPQSPEPLPQQVARQFRSKILLGDVIEYREAGFKGSGGVQ